MSQVDQTVCYTESHEWVRVEGDVVVVGISDHAQSLLGDLVYVELPTMGKTVSRGQEMGVVESVKAASDIYAPVSGTVVEVNKALEGAPELVNQAPHGKGWICKLKMSAPAEVNQLLSAEAYGQLIA